MVNISHYQYRYATHLQLWVLVLFCERDESETKLGHIRGGDLALELRKVDCLSKDKSEEPY